MSRLQSRGLIPLAAVLVAILWARPADAQFIGPAPPRQPGGLYYDVVTAVEYDRANRAVAVHHLQHLRAKLSRDAERGDSAAQGRDVRLIEVLKFRIGVDDWLIRKNSLQDPGCYPNPIRLDPISCRAIADAARPAPGSYNSPPLPTP